MEPERSREKAWGWGKKGECETISRRPAVMTGKKITGHYSHHWLHKEKELFGGYSKTATEKERLIENKQTESGFI